MTYSHITITPIGKGSGKMARRARADYQEQHDRNFGLHDNQFWCWDADKGNTSQTGELFAFRNNNTETVAIHKILAVKDPSERLVSWGKNIGQGDRNVLELSAPLVTLPTTAWVNLGGSNGRLGTQRCHKGFRRTDLLYRQLICTLPE